MSSPSSSSIGLVSANIKLFNSKSDNESTSNNQHRNINNRPATTYVPPLPPKPVKKVNLESSLNDNIELNPPPLPNSAPPPLPSTPPRPLHRNGSLKQISNTNHNTTSPSSLINTAINNSHNKKSNNINITLNSSTTTLTPAPIVAQKSGSTLKGMFEKVVGSVSGIVSFIIQPISKANITWDNRFMDCTKQFFKFFCVEFQPQISAYWKW